MSKGETEGDHLVISQTEDTAMEPTGGLPCTLVRISLSLLAMFHFENPRLCLRCSREAGGEDRNEPPTAVRSETPCTSYGSVNNNSRDEPLDCIICDDMRPKTRLLYNRDSKNLRKVICYTISGILTVVFVLQPLQKVYFRWANQSEILYLFYFLAFFMPPLLIVVCRAYAVFSTTKVTNAAINTSGVCALTNDFIHGLLNRTNDKFVPLKRSVLIRGMIYNFCVLKYIGLYTSFQVSIFRADCPEISGWGVFGCIVDMMGVLVFTEFWYVIYLLRLAVQLEFKSICVTLTSEMPTGRQNYDRVPGDVKRREHEIQDGSSQDSDVFRRRIMESFLDFTRLNNLITHLLTITMSATIFKCSCHLYWNFHVFNTYTETFRIPALLINLTVWDSILMFLIIPLVSVGSINISYVWDDFLNYLDYELGCGKRWIVEFVEKKKSGSNSVEIAMIALTAISIFVAFSFPVEQYGKYWTEDSICLYNNTLSI
ncbi:uncharacterized protein [Ptychodera flava]|uniref:uncharacterized protein n=1 Tax=Ptychodera flava TaxID=63121 RepID=UPI003969D815